MDGFDKFFAGFFVLWFFMAIAAWGAVDYIIYRVLEHNNWI